MKLSIIVTVYNRERYIERCLLSLLNQQLNEKEYEIVVINDGSTDNSEHLIDQLAHTHPVIKKISKTNSGVADTRNVGLEAAQGDYITYVDSDDFVEPNIYKNLLDMAYQHDYDIIMYDAYTAYDDRKEYYEFNENLKEGRITNQEYILSSPAPWNKLMKRKLFEEGNIRFPSGIIYEDYATIPLLANVATSIYYAKIPVVNYYQGNASITRTEGFNEKWWDMYKATQNLEKMDVQYHDEIEYIVYLYFLYRTSVWYLQCDRFEELVNIAEYMREKYPNWRRNHYIGNRSRKERITAYLLYKKWGRLVRFIQKFK